MQLDQVLALIPNKETQEKLGYFFEALASSDLDVVGVQYGNTGAFDYSPKILDENHLCFNLKHKNSSGLEIRKHTPNVMIAFHQGELSTVMGDEENLSVMLQTSPKLHASSKPKVDFFIAHIEDFLSENLFYHMLSEHGTGSCAGTNQSLYACLQQHFNQYTVLDQTTTVTIIERVKLPNECNVTDQKITFVANSDEDVITTCNLNKQQQIIVDYLCKYYNIEHRKNVAC